MLKKKFIISIIIIIYLLLCKNIYNYYSYISRTIINNDPKISQIIDSDYIGYIYIPKINLKKNLFSIESNKNNLEYNVEILKETIFPNNNSNNSIIFLAAHSGPGDNAYFNNLKLLKINDEIILSYNNIIYKYIIIEKKEVIKNGYILDNRKSNDEIVLTTCSDNKDKQLIINGILKSN